MKIDSWITGRRLVSLPKTNYCDPLVTSVDQVNALLDRLREVVKAEGLRYYEIRTQRNAEMFNWSTLRHYDFYLNHILDLTPGRDALWRRFHRSCVRQRIERAKKDGLVVREGDGLHDLVGFYTLYKANARRHSFAARPFVFFENIWELLGPERRFLLVAEIDNILIGGALFYRFKEAMIFQFLALNYDFRVHSPGHALAWEAIQRALAEGVRWFDFGATDPKDCGLLEFKRRWGAEMKALRYFYYPDVRGYKGFVGGEQGRKWSIERGNMVRRIEVWAAERLYRHFG